MSRWRPQGFTLWHVVATMPWIVAILVARSSIGDNSFLWHVTAGRVQLDTGSVITEDPFSLLHRGDAWRTQSWLADIGYGWLDEGVGLAFVPLLRGAMAVLLFAIVALTCRSVTRSLPVTASVSFLLALLAVPYLNPRPVLFSYVLLALVVLSDRIPRLRWMLPLLFYVWASLHGSWVIGGAWLALRVLETKEYRRIAREAPIIAAVTLVTAHGWGVIDYLMSFARSGEALDLISEWAAPDLISVSRAPFSLALAILMIGAGAGRTTVRQLVFSVPVIAFGLTSNRSVLPAFILLVPLLAQSMRGFAPRRFSRELKGVSVVMIAILALPFAIPVDGGLDEDRFAVRLVELAEGTRLFHDDVVGGYIIYASWPETFVLVDDRAELYGDSLEEFVNARSGAEGWQEYFEEHDLDMALVDDDRPLAELLRREGWTPVDSNDSRVLLSSPG